MLFMKTIKNQIRKVYYLKSFLKFRKYGNNILLSRGGTIIRPSEITLGNNIFISNNFHISARNLIIQNNVMIGPNLVIESDNHRFDKIGSTMFSVGNDRIIKGVTINSDVWIGANVTILSGSLISEGCVIGACSLVNRYIPPYTISFGIPAKPVRTRFSKDNLRKHLIAIGKQNEYTTILSDWKKFELI